MANFAVLDGINIINIIISDSKEIAEGITGLTCVEYSDSDNAEPGGTYENGVFLKKKPYPSWVLDENNNWVSPVPAPVSEDTEREFYWDEDSLSWKEA